MQTDRKGIRKRWVQNVEKYTMLIERQFRPRIGKSSVTNFLLRYYKIVAEILQERDE